MMFFLSDDRRGGGDCFEAEQKNKRVFSSEKRKKGGMTEAGNFITPFFQQAIINMRHFAPDPISVSIVFTVVTAALHQRSLDLLVR